MLVKVMSAVMGSGKTTKMIEEIGKANLSEPVMYVAPLLSECHRIAGTTPVCAKGDEDEIDMSPQYVDNSTYLYNLDHPLVNRQFKHPEMKKGGSKLVDLHKRIDNGDNLVTTHALFRNLTCDIVTMIEERGYHLYLDEVLNVYEEYSELSKDELNELFKAGLLYLDEDGITLRFNRGMLDGVHSRYAREAALCDLGQLTFIRGSVVFWEMPVKALKAFKSITIATYLYEGSLLKTYLEYYNIDVVIDKFGNSPKEFKDLITIVQDRKYNDVGKQRTNLSKTHSKQAVTTLKTNLNWFNRYCCKAKAGELLWTSYKDYKRDISGGRFSKSWLACNTKATNEYADTKYVAYLINLHMKAHMLDLISHKGGEDKQDIWALSEMVQFIWRSQIRKGLPIVVYVPSSRMRDLLERWLEGEFDNVN